MKSFGRSMCVLAACCLFSARLGLGHAEVVQARELIFYNSGLQIFLDADLLLNGLGSFVSSDLTSSKFLVDKKNAETTVEYEEGFDENKYELAIRRDLNSGEISEGKLTELTDNKSWFSHQILGGGRLEFQQYVHPIFSLHFGLNLRIDNSERYDAGLLRVPYSSWTNCDRDRSEISKDVCYTAIDKDYTPIVRMPGGEYYRYFPYFNNNYDSLVFRMPQNSDSKYGKNENILVLSGFELNIDSFMFGSIGFNDHRSAGTQAAALFAPDEVTPASDNFRYLNLLGTSGVSIDPGILDKGLRFGYSHTLPIQNGDLFFAASYTFATFQGVKNFAQSRIGTVNYIKNLMQRDTKSANTIDTKNSKLARFNDEGTHQSDLAAINHSISLLNHSRSAISLGAVYTGQNMNYDYVIGAGLSIFGKTALEQSLKQSDSDNIGSFYAFSIGGKVSMKNWKFGLGMNLVTFPVAWQVIYNKGEDGDNLIPVAGTEAGHLANKLKVLSRPSHLRADLSGSAKYNFSRIPLTVGVKLSGSWVSTCGQVSYGDGFVDEGNVANCFRKSDPRTKTSLYSNSEYKLGKDDLLGDGTSNDSTSIDFYAFEVELGADYRFSKYLSSFVGIRVGYDDGVTMYPQLKVAGGNRENNKFKFGIFGGISFVI